MAVSHKTQENFVISKIYIRFLIKLSLEYFFLKADTHEGLFSRSMLQEHASVAKLLRVYQRFRGYSSSSGAEFPPRKMLHDI